MYRRLPQSLPKDPKFPHNLDKLGYFINDNDELRKKEHPEESFQFFITDNARYNEAQREAFHACIRNEIITRMTDLDVPPLYLPDLTSTKSPPSSPHLAIFATPAAKLREKRHVILFIGQASQDLGILSYRILAKQGGIAVGSVLALTKELLNRRFSSSTNDDDSEIPGIIILNPGQTLYSHTHATALTHTAWDALPRASAAHPAPRVHKLHNHIRGSTNATEHLDFAFENIIENPAFVAKDASIYIIGVGNGADDVLQHLERNRLTAAVSKPRIAALALAEPRPLHACTAPRELLIGNSRFLNFLRTRSRAWVTSTYPLNTPLANTTPTGEMTSYLVPVPSEEERVVELNRRIYLQPQMAGGEAEYDECVLPKAYKAVVDWLEEVSKGGRRYANPEMEISKEVQEDVEKEMESWRGGKGWDAADDVAEEAPAQEAAPQEALTQKVVAGKGIAEAEKRTGNAAKKVTEVTEVTE